MPGERGVFEHSVDRQVGCELGGINVRQQPGRRYLWWHRFGVEAERAGPSGSRTTVLALAPPPAKGDQVKIEDDGSAAEQLVDWLVERKLL